MLMLVGIICLLLLIQGMVCSLRNAGEEEYEYTHLIYVEIYYHHHQKTIRDHVNRP